MKFAAMLLFFSMMALGCSVADAGPSANRIKQGPGLLDTLLGDDDAGKSQKPAAEGERLDVRMPPRTSDYDGVWHDASGRTLLIKKINRTLFLSGSSDSSAWQAQCVVSASTATCLGSGTSKMDGEFRYKSDLQLGATNLQVDWKLNYSNGHTDSGHAVYQQAL